jgi:hypothetical protein
MEKKIKITEEEMQDALMRSGYFLETRVESLLRKCNFHVEPNCAYLDTDTKKSRELDIYATSFVNYGKEDSVIHSIPLIECVRPPQPIVFLNKISEFPSLAFYDLKIAGFPINLVINNMWSPLLDLLVLDRFHHCSNEIATQYCSFEIKKHRQNEQAWIANHIDDHFDAIQTLCKSTLYFREETFRQWKLEKPIETRLKFYWPILVIDGELYKAQEEKSRIKLTHTQHIIFRRTVILDGQESTFYIDVVTEKYLPELIYTIEREMKEIADEIKKESETFTETKKILVEKISRAQSDDEIYRILSFSN